MFQNNSFVSLHEINEEAGCVAKVCLAHASWMRGCFPKLCNRPRDMVVGLSDGITIKNRRKLWNINEL